MVYSSCVFHDQCRVVLTSPNRNLHNDFDSWTAAHNVFRCMHGLPSLKWNSATAGCDNPVSESLFTLLYYMCMRASSEARMWRVFGYPLFNLV